MTSRAKFLAASIAIASAALFLGFATFDQWSAFVAPILKGLAS